MTPQAPAKQARPLTTHEKKVQAWDRGGGGCWCRVPSRAVKTANARVPPLPRHVAACAPADAHDSFPLACCMQATGVFSYLVKAVAYYYGDGERKKAKPHAAN
jgi:hypothetical protein